MYIYIYIYKKKDRARTKLAMRTEQKNCNKLAKSYVRASQELVEI